LQDNGVVVASIPNIRYYRILKEYIVRGNWEYKSHRVMDIGHLRFFTYKSIIKMFSQAGYKILKIEGIHPTSSRTFTIINLLLFKALSDARYKHFAVVAQKQ
jgi:hypothetical protein